MLTFVCSVESGAPACNMHAGKQCEECIGASYWHLTLFLIHYVLVDPACWLILRIELLQRCLLHAFHSHACNSVSS